MFYMPFNIVFSVKNEKKDKKFKRCYYGCGTLGIYLGVKMFVCNELNEQAYCHDANVWTWIFTFRMCSTDLLYYFFQNSFVDNSTKSTK